MDDRNFQLKILGHVCKFALDVKICIGLAPGRTAEVEQGGAKSGEFFWVRRKGGRWTKREVKTLFWGRPLILMCHRFWMLLPTLNTHSR